MDANGREKWEGILGMGYWGRGLRALKERGRLAHVWRNHREPREKMEEVREMGYWVKGFGIFRVGSRALLLDLHS